MGGLDGDHFEVFVFHVGHIDFIRAGVELCLLRGLGLDPEVHAHALFLRRQRQNGRFRLWNPEKRDKDTLFSNSVYVKLYQGMLIFILKGEVSCKADLLSLIDLSRLF